MIPTTLTRVSNTLSCQQLRKPIPERLSGMPRSGKGVLYFLTGPGPQAAEWAPRPDGLGGSPGRAPLGARGGALVAGGSSGASGHSHRAASTQPPGHSACNATVAMPSSSRPFWLFSNVTLIPSYHQAGQWQSVLSQGSPPFALPHLCTVV